MSAPAAAASSRQIFSAVGLRFWFAAQINKYRRFVSDIGSSFSSQSLNRIAPNRQNAIGLDSRAALTKIALTDAVRTDRIMPAVRFFWLGPNEMYRVLSIICLMVVLPAVFLAGCESGPETTAAQKEIGPLGEMIGELGEVFVFEPIPVTGYGVVAGLPGTGSSQYPPEAGKYLKNYILSRAPGIDAGAFLNRRDTAVVGVSGLIPAGASKGRRFDIAVQALSGTQTKSLAGGRLYTAELSARGGLKQSRPLARAKGPIYIDRLAEQSPNERRGYVLDGAVVIQDFDIGLALFEPDYINSNVIRNRINERFGDGTARAVRAGIVYLDIPSRYENRKARFLSLVKALYVRGSEQLDKRRVDTLIPRLVAGPDRARAEFALEAIGQPAVRKLGALLNSSQQEVRLRAGRALLYLGEQKGLDTLREIALSGTGEHRIGAIEAVSHVAARSEAVGLLRTLLADSNFDVRLAAYEALVLLEDVSITRYPVAGNFYVDQPGTGGPPVIYASRSATPTIVLFGGPMYCREGFFVESNDRRIIIDGRPEKKEVLIIRQLPDETEPLSTRADLELISIIRALSGEAVSTEAGMVRGLAVPYCDTVAILQKMADQNIIEAEFRAGPLPKVR